MSSPLTRIMSTRNAHGLVGGNFNCGDIYWETSNCRFALGFQHFPRDLANVNEWKIMFDPSIVTSLMLRTLGLKIDLNAGAYFESILY